MESYFAGCKELAFRGTPLNKTMEAGRALCSDCPRLTGLPVIASTNTGGREKKFLSQTGSLVYLHIESWKPHQPAYLTARTHVPRNLILNLKSFKYYSIFYLSDGRELLLPKRFRAFGVFFAGALPCAENARSTSHCRIGQIAFSNPLGTRVDS